MTKNSQTHRVFLPAKVRDIIAELGTGSGFVFGDPPAIDAAMRDICKALDVPRATPHDLRRTRHNDHRTRLWTRFNEQSPGTIARAELPMCMIGIDMLTKTSASWKQVAARIIALAEGTQIFSNVVPLRT